MSIRTLGPHRVQHGDLMGASGMDDLMGSDKCSLFYSDPPWGDGAIRMFATMNEKMTGERNGAAGLQDFMDRFFDTAAKFATQYVVIEYGERWADLVQNGASAVGFRCVGMAKSQYKGGKGMLPMDVHVFTVGEQIIPPGYLEGIEGTHGYGTLQAAVPPLLPYLDNKVVLDPCCGLGYTAQACVDNGLEFRGNEVNLARLDRTVARITKGPKKP